jgi:hypothetical protein
MKAITIDQPGASLIAIGAMIVETRPLSTDYRGPLAIHATKKTVPVEDPYHRMMFESAGLDWRLLPKGVLVATCTLIDCNTITRANTPCYPEYAFGNYTPGWYAWRLSDIRPLPEPIPARGRRGLWDYSGMP